MSGCEWNIKMTANFGEMRNSSKSKSTMMQVETSDCRYSRGILAMRPAVRWSSIRATRNQMTFQNVTFLYCHPRWCTFPLLSPAVVHLPSRPFQEVDFQYFLDPNFLEEFYHRVSYGMQHSFKRDRLYSTLPKKTSVGKMMCGIGRAYLESRWTCHRRHPRKDLKVSALS